MYILQSIAIAFTNTLYFFLRIHSQPNWKVKSPKNKVSELYGTGKSTKNGVEVVQWTLISLILDTLVSKNQTENMFDLWGSQLAAGDRGGSKEKETTATKKI